MPGCVHLSHKGSDAVGQRFFPAEAVLYIYVYIDRVLQPNKKNKQKINKYINKFIDAWYNLNFRGTPNFSEWKAPISPNFQKISRILEGSYLSEVQNEGGSNVQIL